MLRNRLASAVSAATLVALAAAGPALADVPTARIEGVEDEDLRAILQTAVGSSQDRPASRFEARRRAREAREDAIAALRSEGYYAAVVEPDVSDGEQPQAVLRITPGERFVFGDTAIAWQGPPPQGDARTAALAATGLAQGAPGRAEDVVEGEGRAVAALSSRGYADARTEPREVIVDHATQLLAPTYRIAAGPLVRLNGLQMETTGRTRRDWILRLAPWAQGDVYDPDDVGELERRLLDTGVYDSVTVALAPPAQTTADGLRPVVVSLADRPRRTIEAGAGYSTSEGIGVEAELNRYNQLGRGDTLTLRAALAQIDRRVAGELALPHFTRANRTLRLGAEAFQEKTEAYDGLGVGVRADITQRFGRTTFFTYGAEAELSQTQEDGEERNFVALTGIGGFALDRSNDILNPVRGYRLEGRLEPTALTGDASLLFVRSQAQGTAYVPFDEEGRTSVAGRIRLGAIVGGEIPTVPADRRFYAGGGGSVRGYEFQAIGPRRASDPDKPEGGLSLVEGSLELRRQGFGEEGIWRALGGVVFVDAGAVGSEEFADFAELKAAVGFGVRFDLGFAPVRADVAFTLDAREGESPFQIYVSLGQAF